MRVTLQGRTEARKGFLNTIAHDRRLAGSLHLTPRDLANDGLLDVCMCAALSRPIRFKKLGSATRRAHLADRVECYYRLDENRGEFDAEVPTHADGELLFASSFDLEVVQGILW